MDGLVCSGSEDSDRTSLLCPWKADVGVPAHNGERVKESQSLQRLALALLLQLKMYYSNPKGP